MKELVDNIKLQLLEEMEKLDVVDNEFLSDMKAVTTTLEFIEEIFKKYNIK